MMIATSPAIAGRKIVTTLGVVRGNTIRARHVGRDILAGLRMLVGGEISDYTKMMAEAREQSLDRMTAEAGQLGANAIVDVRFSTSYIMTGAAEILVYGTAVVIEEA
ncbi:MAG: YbjQ family protein [Pseudohongiella sp.]|uniref:YbjQ family protein n=1 Tax=Pseudohongiella sp. TaxID=1979412 RepID=UPI0034A011DC